MVVKEKSLALPETHAKVIDVDFAAMAIKPGEWALAALAVLAAENILLTGEMLAAGIAYRYRGKMLGEAKAVVGKILAGSIKD